MSRFYDTGYEPENDEEEQTFLDELEAEYAQAAPDFKGFLSFLDAMEPKRIIADRFFKPRTGEVCSVAAFCRYKGYDDAKMRAVAIESAQQRREYGGHEEPYEDGATVCAGQRAGLPGYVAQDLMVRNDENWNTVQIGYEPCTCTGEPGFHYPWDGRYNKQCRYKSAIYDEMTPEERWFKLRNFIAHEIGAEKLPLPPRLQREKELLARE